MATEIVCAECGTTNQAGEDFCGECGAYLEWDGRAAEPEPEPEPVPEPVAEEAPRTVVERVKAAVGIGTDEEAPAEQEKPAETPAPAEPAARKAATPVAAVLPGAAAPKARKRSAAPLDQPLQPGDLVCGSCGAGNSPSRKFCRRCGHDLSEADVAKIPWWRRIFPQRRARTKVAGTRPRQRRRSRLPSYVRIVVVLALVVGVVYLTKPLWTPAYDMVLDRVKGTEAANPVPASIVASSQIRGHPARAVHDGGSDRSWAVAPIQAHGQWVRMNFASPQRLVYVIVTPGVSTKEKPFLANGRPAELRFTAYRKGGDAVTKDVPVKDESHDQTFHFAVSDVDRFKVTILKARHGDPGTHVAIAEVEFRVRK